jgi:hypothetical protein
MFAVGPISYNPHSDALDASLKLHSLNAVFNMDVTQAYGNTLPELGTENAGSTFTRGKHSPKHDSDSGTPVHAAFMCLTFVVVFPVGVFTLRFLHRVKLHAIVQSIGLLLASVGLIVGFVISKMYNKVNLAWPSFSAWDILILSKSTSFGSSHQNLGIGIYVLLLAQWLTGYLHHITFAKTRQPTWMIKPHKLGLGALAISLGLVNCAIGFSFADNGSYNRFYLPIALGVVIILVGAMILKQFVSSKKVRPAKIVDNKEIAST